MMSQSKRTTYFFAFALMVGCGTDEGHQLLVPEDILMDWDESFNAEEDGIAAVIPVDMMVYDAVTGDPVTGEEVSLSSLDDAVSFLEKSSIVQVEHESTIGDTIIWDVWRDQVFEMNLADSSNELTLETDDAGLVRVYLYVDAFSEGEALQFLPAQIQVRHGDAEDLFAVQPR